MRRSITQAYLRGLVWLINLVVAIKFFVEASKDVVVLLHFCLPISHSTSLCLSL